MIKKTFLNLSILCFSVFATYAQYQIDNNFYKHYQRFMLKENGRALDQEGGQYDSNVYVANHHGGSNQQWAVMPLYIKAKEGDVEISRDHIIASRKNGKVLDISGSTNIYCYGGGFHGGDNQIFNFNTRPNNYWEIASPARTGKVFDKTGSKKNKNPFYHPQQHKDNIYAGNVHGGNNQQFRIENQASIGNNFSELRYQRTTQIPKPKDPTSFDEQMPVVTPETFHSETLIPFAIVKNDPGFPGHIQVERSPYYKLVRSQFYIIPKAESDSDFQPDQIYLPGQVEKREIKVKTGMKITEVSEIIKKLNISFTSNGEVGIKIPKTPISLKASSSLSSGFEMSIKEINSYEETYEKTVTLTNEFKVSNKIRVIHYVLVDRYRLYRMDGTLANRWDVKTNEKHLSSFTDGKKIQIIKDGNYFKFLDAEPICWTNARNININGNSFTKKAGIHAWWNAGASSDGIIPSGKDGWVKMTLSEINSLKMFGLSHTDTNYSWDTIDYNFYTKRNKIEIWESGMFRGKFGTCKEGDIIRVERSGHKILYKKNGEVIYSSTTNPNISLLADTSIHTAGGKITDAYASFKCLGKSASSSIIESGSTFNSKLYHNLESKEVTINFNQTIDKGNITVFNLLGKQVKEITVQKTNQQTINTGNLPNGIYLAKVHIGSYQQTLKFVVR